jgi:hypothetical protein
MTMDAQWSSISAQLQGSFLERQIRRTNRSLLVCSLLLVGSVAIYGAVEWRYYYNFFKGPFEANSAWLESVQHPDEQLKYFVRVQGGDSTDTGIQEVETESGGGSPDKETVTSKYSILHLGKRLLIVKSGPRGNGTLVQGALRQISSEEQSNVVAPLIKEVPEASQAFLPMVLDTTDFRDSGWIAFVIGTPLLGLAGWIYLKLYRRRMAPLTHPIVRSVARYGSIVDTAHQFDTELRGNLVKVGKATITNSWVLVASEFNLALCRIPDLVWAYKKVTKHSYNGIPAGKTYVIVLYDRHGLPLQIQGKQKNLDSVLALLAERAPWAIIGYSDQLNLSVRTKWPGLVASVDARRSGVAAAR